MSEFWKAALIRAGHTFCQALIVGIGGAQLFEEVSWPYVLSSAGLMALLSILKSCAIGMPEVPKEADDDVRD